MAEVQPPERVWSAIEQRVFAPDESNVIDLKRRVTMWRGFAVAATAIAAALAVVMVMPSAQPPVQRVTVQATPLVATLASEQTADRLVATWDPAQRSLIVAAAAGMQPKPGKDHELWVIPAGGKPLPVGIMRRAGAMRMTLPIALAAELKRGATLAVSVEPAGGSPTGLPTGPVIAAGAFDQT